MERDGEKWNPIDFAGGLYAPITLRGIKDEV
jgi:hypothetical protein